MPCLAILPRLPPCDARVVALEARIAEIEYRLDANERHPEHRRVRSRVLRGGHGYPNGRARPGTAGHGRANRWIDGFSRILGVQSRSFFAPQIGLLSSFFAQNVV